MVLSYEEEATESYLSGYARMWKTNNAWKQTESATIKLYYHASKGSGSGKPDKVGDLARTEELCLLSALNRFHPPLLFVKPQNTPK